MSETIITTGRAQLYRKIAAVTAAVRRIPKNGTNQFHHYSYALESDITDGLRDLLAEHGLAFLPPTVLEWERGEPDAKNSCLTRVRYRFGLADCDTGEVVESEWWAEAQDNADKAFNKAATSASKYWLMKTFLIATGDDPDDGGQPQTRPAAPTTRGETASRQQKPESRTTGSFDPALGAAAVDNSPPATSALAAAIGPKAPSIDDLVTAMREADTLAELGRLALQMPKSSTTEQLKIGREVYAARRAELL